MSFQRFESWMPRNFEPLRVGVIGCGVISQVYLRSINHSRALSLVACSGRNDATSAAQAVLHGGRASSIDALLSDHDIECVVNLTPPAAHFEISRRILESGKHLYTEKPLATSLDDASRLLEISRTRNLLVGSAPDTFLGPGHQAARKAIDDGLIGRPVGGSIALASHGMEHWHPNPGFFYQPGGGPALDVGPYYITQLVNLLGPICEVTALASMPSQRRLISSEPLAGSFIDVGVSTTVNGALRFVSGANVSLTMSWDIWKHTRPFMEIYGDAGTLLNPDPNEFSGKVLASHRDGEWMEQGYALEDEQTEHLFARLGGPRGIGLVDMALAIRSGQAPRASGELALHVLETLLGLEASAATRQSVEIRSRVERPAPV